MKDASNVAAARALFEGLAETTPRAGLSETSHEIALGKLSDSAQTIGLGLVEVHREHLGNRPSDVARLAGSLLTALAEYAHAIGEPRHEETKNAEIAGHLRALAVVKRKAAIATDNPVDAEAWPREADRLEALAAELEAN